MRHDTTNLQLTFFSNEQAQSLESIKWCHNVEDSRANAFSRALDCNHPSTQGVEHRDHKMNVSEVAGITPHPLCALILRGWLMARVCHQLGHLHRASRTRCQVLPQHLKRLLVGTHVSAWNAPEQSEMEQNRMQ